MKKKISTSQIGSMMIEALAMLALIATITPILYRKTAERTTDLQDINTAGEIRAIIKAVDDYISANYDAISQGQTVTNSCKDDNGSKNYADLVTNGHISVPIGHFCEFLPYGILDSDGNAKQSKLFSSDYQIALKLTGNDDANGDKVVTAFVVTDPNREIKELRANSIASMIGGNGGRVTEASGDGEDASGGKIEGNLGIWGIDNARTELGIPSVKKGAIVAASIQGISSQNAKIDLEGVLYRKERLDDLDLNTMSTTLYMGGINEHQNNIENIGQLIVGTRDSDTDASLYIDSGSIKINENVEITDEGVVNIASDLTAGGNATITGELSAKDGTFSVVEGALQYGTLLYAGAVDDNSTLSISADKVQATTPLAVTSDADCGVNDGASCALYVAGSGYFGNNLTIQNAFSASNLHARDRLTVGGPNPEDSGALDVTYTDDNNSSFNFGNNVLRVTKGAEGVSEFNFGNYVKFEHKNAANPADYYDRANINFTTLDFRGRNVNTANGFHDLRSPGFEFYMNSPVINNNANAYIKGYNTFTSLERGFLRQYGLGGIESYTNSFKVNNDAFVITSTLNNGDVKLGTTGGVAVDQNPSGHNISAVANSFRITPEATAEANTHYLEVVNEGEAGGRANIQGLNTYITGTADGNRSNVIMKNSNFSMQNSGGANVFQLESEAGEAATGALVKGNKIGMKRISDSTNILKINLADENDDAEEYPVYIRKGAIELKQANEGSSLSNNYVKADRFVVSSTENPIMKRYLSDNNDNPTGIAGNIATYPYQVNPAYTSVMHDIKLTTRGGARLSDILPDFINKGIYVVDNTNPAIHTECPGGGEGLSLAGYVNLTPANKAARDSCTSLYDQASPWTGFVPTPTCPPGYSKVITIVPSSFAMAQAGIPTGGIKEINGGNARHNLLTQDLLVPLEVKSPYDYLTGSEDDDPAPTPLYYQKNTWLKSKVVPYGAGVNFKGWDIIMGFVYPYYQYQSYIEKIAGNNYNPLSNAPSYRLDNSGETLAETVIWNLFPVYAGTLEGTATVYCYFNRSNFDSPYVDTGYDQLNNFRDYYTKGGAYSNRLNSSDEDSAVGAW